MEQDEFPLLRALTLYIIPTRGDGNCLFNALSDQLYGHQDQHRAIRARVIEYMRQHADYYKQFIDVHPGGGIRRNPKRKNAGAYSSHTAFTPPSAAEVDRVFEMHLDNMSHGGTYGDNMEITAFSSAFNTDVKIYQRDFAYMISAGGDEDVGTRPVVHIAYHIWEHYSSIRNLDGPHTGLPNVNPKVLSIEEEEEQRNLLAKSSHVQPWMVDVVQKSLPFLADVPTIRRAIEGAKGDVNLAVSNMLEAEELGSVSSQQESSSVERDHDSDDEMQNGPNKKRDRRMSRASRAMQARSAESKHALAQLQQYDGSQESVNSYDSEASLSGIDNPSQSTLPTQLSTSQDSITYLKVESDSISRSQSPSKPSIKLKLHPPRGPEAPQRVGKTSQRQVGPRMTARDRKEIKKQQQKAARKEREIASARGTDVLSSSPSAVGLALRQKGMTQTPPVTETLRTLYI